MLVDVAFYLLLGAVLLGALAAGAFLLGGVLREDAYTKAGERAIHATTACVAFCSFALIRATFLQDYSVSYVAQVSDRALPGVYKFTAFWAGMNGSMLMWLLFLCAYASAATWSLRGRLRDMAPWIGLAQAVVILFFAMLVAFMANPLERLPFVPDDGQGMNPALQNYWMAIHPPTLYLGYVGLTVPFAFAIGALATGRLGDDWIRAVRRWVLWAWLCLGVGMVFGGHWAYVELGWGGYWAWDPVENASFMPWLAATAFLHSVMVQERRGMFRVWNLALILAAFALSVFGTFITRSGIVESVHSFARSPIGPWFLFFVVAIVAVSVGLLYWRWPLLGSAHRIDSLVSREFGFVLNNLLFVSVCLVTLFLTMYAPISEWLTGERWTVGASAYNEINGTLGLLLLALTGAGPVISWRRASARSLRRSLAAPVVVGALTAAVLVAVGIREPMPLATWSLVAFTTWCILGEFHRGARVVAAHRGVGYAAGLIGLFGRNRRRYGGYVVHLAVVMFFLGVAGMTFREEAEALLSPGDSLHVHGHEVTYVGPAPYRGPGSDVYSVRLAVSREGRHVAELRPEFKIHDKFPEPEKDVAIHQTAAGDLYAILAQPVRPTDPTAKVQVLWNPLVAWIWWSSYVLIAGTLVCAWPDGRRRAAARSEGRARAA